MRARKLRFLAVALLVSISTMSAAVAPSDDSDPPKPKPEKKTERYAVIRVGDEIRVESASALAELRKQIKSDDLQALKSHEEARREAAKSGVKFAEPKPTPTTVKVIKASVATKEAAEKIATGHREALASEPAKVRYAIVLVDQEHQILPAHQVRDFKLGVEEEYKNKLQAYADARKAARANKEKFDQPKPKKPVIKTLQRTFATEEEARAHVAKALDRKSDPGEKKDG